MKIILSFVIILLISKIKTHNVLRIPFKTLSYPLQSSSKLNSINSIILSLIRNDIYLSLEVGSPPQKITSFIKFEEFPFFISGKNIIYSQYDESLSLTYKSEKYPHAFLEGTEKIKWGLVSNDTFNLISNNTNIKIERLNFILVSESRTNSTSNIGLMIPDKYNSIPDISFIYQLKKLKIINDYNFLINYTNSEKNEGELIIGSTPHIYDVNNFNQKYYRTTYAIEKPNYMMYGLNFDEILIGENGDKLSGTRQSKFLCDFGLIVGSIDYYEYIYKNFFEKKIEEKKCYLKNITLNIEWREGEKNYEYFYCEKKFINPKDIQDIFKIKFVHKEMNYTFEFNWEELFYEKDEFYFFKIIFNHKNNFYWIFGKPWLSKYIMVFNQDSKTIGHYYINNDNVFNKKSKNNTDKINWVLMGIICLLILFISIYGIWMINFYKKGRKKRVNEIKDEFDYSLQKDPNKNLINNNINLGLDN